MINEFESVTRILSTLATSIAIFAAIFGVWRYFREQRRVRYAEFRSSLNELTGLAHQFDQKMEEAAFSEIGFRIANEVRAIRSKKWTSENLQALTNDQYTNYLITAVDVALRDSAVKRELDEWVIKLESVPTTHEMTMPVVCDILSSCLELLRWAVENVAGRRCFVQAIKDEEWREILFTSLVEVDDDINLVFREIGERFAAVSGQHAMPQGRELAYSVGNVVDIVVDMLRGKSDKELDRIRKRNSRLYGSTPVPKDVLLPIDRAFFFLELQENDYSRHEWDIMLESKITIGRLIK